LLKKVLDDFLEKEKKQRLQPISEMVKKLEQLIMEKTLYINSYQQKKEAQKSNYCTTIVNFNICITRINVLEMRC